MGNILGGFLTLFLGSFGQIFSRVNDFNGSLDKWWLLLFFFPPLSIVPAIYVWSDLIKNGEGNNPVDTYFYFIPLLCILLGKLHSRSTRMALFITILAIYTLARYSKRQETCVSNPENVDCCNLSYGKAAAIKKAQDQGLILTDDEKQYLMYTYTLPAKNLEEALLQKYFNQIKSKRDILNSKGQGLDYSTAKTSNSAYNNYDGIRFDPSVTAEALASEIPNLPKEVDEDESLEPSFMRSLSEACIVTIVVYFMGTVMKYAEKIPYAGYPVGLFNGVLDSIDGLKTGFFFAFCHLIQNMIANTPSMKKNFCKTLSYKKAEFYIPIILIIGLFFYQEFMVKADDVFNNECEDYCDKNYGDFGNESEE